MYMPHLLGHAGWPCQTDIAISCSILPRMLQKAAYSACVFHATRTRALHCDKQQVQTRISE